MKCARASALIAIAICFVACSNAQDRQSDAKVSQLERKVPIVYLSRTNNTKAVAASDTMRSAAGLYRSN